MSPLPWTRMRRVYALFGLVQKYGPERVEHACRTALEVEMHDVRRLERMLAHPLAPSSAARAANVVPLARYLRPACSTRCRSRPTTEPEMHR